MRGSAKPCGFFQAAAGAIARNGISQLFGTSETHARRLFIIPGAGLNHNAIHRLRYPLRGGEKILAVEKSLDHLERSGLSREALAGLGAAAGDDAAATNSCHTGAEAMAALADKLGWLIGALHGQTPIIETKLLI
jgi:hypothetical protein